MMGVPNVRFGGRGSFGTHLGHRPRAEIVTMEMREPRNGLRGFALCLVGDEGLEPPTSRM